MRRGGRGRCRERLGAGAARAAGRGWLGGDSRPGIKGRSEGAEGRRRSELEGLLRRLPSLSEEDRALVDQMSHRLVAGILHAPRSRLRLDDSGDLGRAARELFGL